MERAFAAKPIFVTFAAHKHLSDPFDLAFSRLFGVTYPSSFPSCKMRLQCARSHETSPIYRDVFYDDFSPVEIGARNDAHMVLKYPAPLFGIRQARFHLVNNSGADVSVSADTVVTLLVME